MSQLQKPATTHQSPSNANYSGGSPGNDGLEVLRAESSSLLAAADEVINRALSQDSEAFTNQVRQRGGQ
jgi:hypothetical protein